VLELMLADARTPSGGYAHSGGLESAVEAGLEVGEVPGFIFARLATVGFIDACVAGAASGCDCVDALLDLDAEWAARCPAPPLRQAARALGRGLLRTATRWFPSTPLISDYLAASALTPRPVALGVIARAGGLSAEATACAALYDDAAGVAAAAVKLMALDAAVSSSWVLTVSGEIESLAALAASVAISAGPMFAALPSASTPLLDSRALDHATSERRLFAS
jgi:urease accessory protein